MSILSLQTKLPLLPGHIMLHPLTDKNKSVNIYDLISTSPCILLIIKSTTCMLCRKMMDSMNQHASTFKNFNIKIHCILMGTLEDCILDQIQFDKADIYVDYSNSLYSILHNDYGNIGEVDFSDCEYACNEANQELKDQNRDPCVVGGQLLVSEFGEVIYKSKEGHHHIPDIESI
ncbi:hypothetical protein BC833DRAFT_597052 [Globomyces pollinis-pini]|nr:hypothetical protein BC833DRAFT_597052 [Globomyces pollinis-pini]